jgi:hypothetical protein
VLPVQAQMEAVSQINVATGPDFKNKFALS